MTIASEIFKVVAAWKQTGLGAPRSGNGSQALRRESSKGTLTKATYENNEITSHQQSTGATHGMRSAAFTLNGLLSGNTYSTLFASIMRAAFATGATTSASITITMPGGVPTLTDAANTFLTDGFKIGDVVRITAGTYANAVNRDNNLLILSVSETVITGVTLNGSVMIAEGPIAASTLAVKGKKCVAPLTGHTRDYWTVEEFQSDITQSELFTDTMFGSVDISIPASGNTTVAFNAIALDRTPSGAQVLTTPTAETTTSVVQGIKGVVIVQGVSSAVVTGATIKIDGGAQALDGCLGSNVAPDIVPGILKVSGQITAYYENGTLSGYFDDETAISIAIVDAVDDTNASEFVSFVMSKVKLFGDDKDNGAKGVIRTYPFTAEINGAGGTALANAKTILSIQDSLAA